MSDPSKALCLVSVSLWLGASACSPATPSLPLSGTLRAHLEAEHFGVVTSTFGLPVGVRNGLQDLFGSTALDIADPGAELQSAGGAADAKVPSRRLVVAGCSGDHCLVYYERAGSPSTWRVALFHWTPEETRFEWGGAAPGDLAAIEDVRRAIVAGKITSPDKTW